MDLKQHESIILKWLNSCETAEQLILLDTVINKFVFERFSEMYETISSKSEKESMMRELNVVVKYLRDAIVERNLVIAGGQNPKGKERPALRQPPN